MSYITGLAGTPGPGYFTDNLGHPKLWVATETWALPERAGEWTSGNWQGDYDSFFSERSAQGFTVTMTDPVASTTAGAPNDNGNTWDGLTPLAAGSTDPSSAALNNTFWARIDYMFSSAETNGMTIGLVPFNPGTYAPGPQVGWRFIGPVPLLYPQYLEPPLGTLDVTPGEIVPDMGPASGWPYFLDTPRRTDGGSPSAAAGRSSKKPPEKRIANRTCPGIRLHRWHTFRCRSG